MDEWICVEVEMPVPNMTVDVKYVDGRESSAFWYYGDWRMVDGIVTHWRPSGISIEEYRRLINQ